MAVAKYRGEYEERVKSVLNEVEKAAEDGGPGVRLNTRLRRGAVTRLRTSVTGSTN